VQVPAVQTSPVVHAFPSLHEVPSGDTGFTHLPLLGSHVPAVWHWSCAGQMTAEPAHVPPVQMSTLVQTFPSLHAVPSASGGLEQAPVFGSQLPAAWHWSGAAHVTGFEPVHAPDWQA